MIAVDASAVLAVFLGEPDAQIYVDRLADIDVAVMSSVNYWEVLVKARLLRGEAGEAVVARLLADLRVTIAPVTSETARAAADAFMRFRGRSGGRLNLGDTFAYALAEREGDGLLFKGNDFPRTDVKNALG